MSTHRPARRRTTNARRLILAATVSVAALAPLIGSFQASGQSETPPPNTFGLRLEGFAVEKNTFTTATAVTPRSAYSYAKVSSFLDLDGGRGLDMEARGANDQYGGLAGAALFAGDMPTDGNNLPGYTQAFYPTFEGFSQHSEKCFANQTEAKETPECREQDGPYALAKVVPDQRFPSALGIGRNQGNEDGQGNTRSSSRIQPRPDGSLIGIQSNSGSDQGVPGTPITVDSYLAETTVTTSLEGSTVDIVCEGKVSVAGQPVNNNKQLQQALSPLSMASAVRVEFEPPTKPQIDQLAGGAFQASCRGPRITVFGSPQGGSGTTYTFGKTLAAVGITDNRDPNLRAPGEGFTPPPTSPPATEPPPATTGSSGSGSSPISTAPAPAPTSAPTTTAPVVDFGDDEQQATNFIREPIDALPIAVLTAVGAGLLPLAIWMLLGVTGALARGLAARQLPPVGGCPLRCARSA